MVSLPRKRQSRLSRQRASIVSFPRKRESRSQKSYDQTGFLLAQAVTRNTGLLPRAGSDTEYGTAACAGMASGAIRLRCYHFIVTVPGLKPYKTGGFGYGATRNWRKSLWKYRRTTTCCMFRTVNHNIRRERLHFIFYFSFPSWCFLCVLYAWSGESSPP